MGDLMVNVLTKSLPCGASRITLHENMTQEARQKKKKKKKEQYLTFDFFSKLKVYLLKYNATCLHFIQQINFCSNNR